MGICQDGLAASLIFWLSKCADVRNDSKQFEKVRNDLIQIEGFDMIAAPNALVYVNPKNDITKKITERMNEQSD